MSDTNEVAVAAADPFIELVERLATNKDVDPDKLQKIVDIQMQVFDRNAETEFNASMSRVQSALPTVLHNAQNKNTSSTYANLDSISKAIKPVYTKEGFSTSFTQASAKTEGHIGIEGFLRHKDGFKVKYWLELPIDATGIAGKVNKTALHAAGSTFTYGRRYLVCLMFDIATGDDTDGVTKQDYERLSPLQLSILTDKFKKLSVEEQIQFLKWSFNKRELSGDEKLPELSTEYFKDYDRNLDKKIAAKSK
jgi:hypothetical protein